MSIQIVVRELSDYLAALSEQREMLQAQLDIIQLSIAGVESTLRRYPEWKESNLIAATPVETGITAKDIAHCSSVKTALIEIAMHTNGIVKSRSAGTLMIEAGLTRSTSLDSASATAYRRMREHSDFEYHEPGAFRYLPYFTRTAEDVEESLPETLVGPVQHIPSPNGYEGDALTVAHSGWSEE